VKGTPPGIVPQRIWSLGTVGFVTVFAVHVLWLYYRTGTAQKGWADNFNQSGNFWHNYLISQDYFVSFSYALSASFAVWATARFLFFRRQMAAVGAFGGVSLVALLAAGGCFLIGCCGSPMLPIYVSVFGYQEARIGKPLMALISLISIGCGYLYVIRRSHCNCTDPKTCPFPEKSNPEDTSRKSSAVETNLHQEEPL
jgi:hypothetical protein